MRISDVNPQEEVVVETIEVKVYGDFENAYRKFKSLVQKEKIIAAYKQRQSYEKPSAKKKRKSREAHQRLLMADAREKLIISGEWEKRQKKKEVKRAKKIAERSQKKAESQEGNE